MRRPHRGQAAVEQVAVEFGNGMVVKQFGAVHDSAQWWHVSVLFSSTAATTRIDSAVEMIG